MRSFQGTMRLCVEYSYLSIFKFLLGIIVLPDTDQRTLLRTCLSTTGLRTCVEDDLLGGLVCRRPSLSRNDKEAIAVRPLGQRRVFWIDREHCMQRAGKHTLDCRHTVRSVCGDSLEKKLALTCPVSDMVTLPCGHLYRLQCGSKESEKTLDKSYCRYLYQLIINWKIMKCNYFMLFRKQEVGGEGKQVRPQDHGRMRKEFIQEGLHFHERENLRLWSPVSAPLPRTVYDRSLQTSSWTAQYHSPVWPSLEGGMQPSSRWYCFCFL